MHTYQIEPEFTTACGTLVDEWPDLELSWHAYAHYKRQYYETSQAIDARQRAKDPDYDENNRRSEERFLELNPQWAGVPVVEFTPAMPRFPEEWQYQDAVHHVRVIAPDLSMTVRSRFEGTDLIEASKHVVNPRYEWSVSYEEPFALRPTIQRNRGYPRDDLDAYCYDTHGFEPLALLHPRCFFHGRIPQWDQRTELTVLDRLAYLLPMVREIPLTDPRVLGDRYNPCVLDEVERTELIVDVERNVILEWRAIFDGKVYERHHFTEIAFDEPMDEADFYPTG